VSARGITTDESHMKPAPFEYSAPTTLTEAISLLSQLGERARPLAGGQSLVPLMNFRLLRPSHLVDLNGVQELNYLRVDHGELRVGAITRQRQLELSPEVAKCWPLLRDATRYIGHVQIRNRGTVGGSLAHAFPSAELPVAMVALDASFVLCTSTGQRTVRAEDFFLSYMTTVLQPHELLVEIRVPALPPLTGWSFQEVSRRHGDFALAGVAALITLDTGIITRSRLTFTGATPLRAQTAETLLLGQKPSETLFREAARQATEGLEQDADIHASAEYRREACEVLARRAFVEAAKRAVDLAEGNF
jgi:CO/xanthine dehydrogenase FAD-binding subunit